jgi:hypothetical protein
MRSNQFVGSPQRYSLSAVMGIPLRDRLLWKVRRGGGTKYKRVIYVGLEPVNLVFTAP